jgi:hypothetical protein
MSFEPGNRVRANKNFPPHQLSMKDRVGTVDFYTEDPMPYVGVVLDEEYNGITYWGFYPEDLDLLENG